MLYRTDIVGLSTEEKPIKGLENGSTYYCVDNGDLYIFYKGEWYSQEFNESKETENIDKKAEIENEEIFVDEK